MGPLEKMRECSIGRVCSRSTCDAAGVLNETLDLLVTNRVGANWRRWRKLVSEGHSCVIEGAPVESHDGGEACGRYIAGRDVPWPGSASSRAIARSRTRRLIAEPRSRGR